ncbi:MAG: hypothetical protein R2770_06610 [Acidimicrobiales bacterium]
MERGAFASVVFGFQRRTGDWVEGGVEPDHVFIVDPTRTPPASPLTGQPLFRVLAGLFAFGLTNRRPRLIRRLAHRFCQQAGFDVVGQIGVGQVVGLLGIDVSSLQRLRNIGIRR